MEFIARELESRTVEYSEDGSPGKPTGTEEDLSVNPNADGAVAAVGLEIQHSEKEVRRDSVDALPGIGTFDPYFKFKLLVEELLIIFTKHEDRCGVCVEYILKLCKHIAETHEDYQNPTQVKFRCDICSKIYLSLIGLTRHRDHHYNSESSHSQSLAIQLSPSFNIYRDTVEIVSDIQPSDLYFKVKLLVEELLIIFTKYEDKCGVCVEYIVKLCKHMGETHEDDHNTEFTCDICGKIFLNTLELTSHHESHMDHNEGDETDETDDTECEVVSKSFKLQRTKIQRKPIEGHITYINYGKKRPFECTMCGKGFARRKNLKIHKLIHTGQKSFKCHLCGKSLSTKSNLKTHKLIHTGEKRFKCDECGKCFLLLGNLRVHRERNNCKKETFGERRREPHKSQKCLTCGELFWSTREFNKHTLIHHGIKPFKCDLCGRSFTRSNNLKVHRLIHSRENSLRATIGTKEINAKKNECNLCGKSFTYLSLLTTHISTHTKERHFKCNICGNSFITSSHLYVHKLIHTGEKPFHCNECGKTFSTKGNLNIHKFVHTGKRPFKCDECGKSFSRKNNFNTHKLIHTGEKPFQCDECAKSFSTKAHLNYHKITHTRVKPFKCDKCDKTYPTKATLKSHKLTHTGEKRFKCDECGKCFLLLGNLRAHEKRKNCQNTRDKNRQDRPKSYKCSMCGELFSSTNALTRHGLIHHGLKPFECDLCGKRLTTSHNLKAHKFMHTREKFPKTHKCLACGRMFWTALLLSTHRFKHTAEKRFKCGLCGRDFIFESVLARHILSHTGEKTFKCDQCEKCFRASWDLRAHKNRNNCKRKKSGDKVNVAMKSIKSPTYGQNNQNTETRDLHAEKSNRNGEWPFKCEFCGKGFFYNCHLMKHTVRHALPGDGPLKCNVCGKGFYYNTKNTQRIRQTGVSPFKCHECGKS